MKLYEHDILFLIQKTKLSLKSLLNLIEDERDFDLVIDSISTNINEDDIREFPKLSEKLRVKIILYHSSRHKNYDISEKSYISNILVSNYNQIYTSQSSPVKGQKRAIKYFISIINDSQIDQNKLSIAAQNFTKLGQSNISNHLYDWIKIIKKSKEFILNNK